MSAKRPVRERCRAIKASMLEALANTLHSDAHDLGAGYLYGEDGAGVDNEDAVDTDHDLIKVVADELERELRHRALRLTKGGMAAEATRARRR